MNKGIRDDLNFKLSAFATQALTLPRVDGKANSISAVETFEWHFVFSRSCYRVLCSKLQKASL